MSIDSPAQAAAEFGLNLRYGCDVERLGPILRERFVQLGPDESFERYLARARARRHGTFKTWLHRSLRGFLSDFDINGLLDTYPMHVLGETQWRHLFDEAGNVHAGGRLLDVGAGNGDATVELAPLFERVTAVETARFMVKRLRSRGFETISGDLSSGDVPGAPYDAISLLNVLDRCDRPLSLLGNLRSALGDGGTFVMALVLPYRPFVYDGGSSRAPTERLPLTTDSFEQSVSELERFVLSPLGFEVRCVSRAPYLSGGDAIRPLYELDDAILVCRAGAPITLVGDANG